MRGRDGKEKKVQICEASKKEYKITEKDKQKQKTNKQKIKITNINKQIANM